MTSKTTTSDKELAAKLREALSMLLRHYGRSDSVYSANIADRLDEAIAALESKSSTKDESLEALEAAVETELDKLRTEVRDRKFGHVPKEYTKEEVTLINATIEYGIGLVEHRTERILKLIADAKEQGEPKETTA